MKIVLVLIGLLVVMAAVLAYAAWRWRRVVNSGGIEVAFRWRTDQADRGWHRGIGRYEGADFAWYRVFSMRSGADRVVNRDDLEIAERREPTDTEAYALPAGATVLACDLAGCPLDIALAPGALIGFLSWLESAPPGRQLPRTS